MWGPVLSVCLSSSPLWGTSNRNRPFEIHRGETHQIKPCFFYHTIRTRIPLCRGRSFSLDWKVCERGVQMLNLCASCKTIHGGIEGFKTFRFWLGCFDWTPWKRKWWVFTLNRQKLLVTWPPSLVRDRLHVFAWRTGVNSAAPWLYVCRCRHRCDWKPLQVRSDPAVCVCLFLATWRETSFRASHPWRRTRAACDWAAAALSVRHLPAHPLSLSTVSLPRVAPPRSV